MTIPDDDDIYPRCEWEPMPWFVFALYLTSKLGQAERDEFRRLLHAVARENLDSAPAREDLVALANSARFLVRGGGEE